MICVHEGTTVCALFLSKNKVIQTKLFKLTLKILLQHLWVTVQPPCDFHSVSWMYLAKKRSVLAVGWGIGKRPAAAVAAGRLMPVSRVG